MDPLDHLKLYQATTNLTAKAEWSFSPWSAASVLTSEANDAAAGFAPWSAKSKSTGTPTWFRTTFSVANTRCPLFVHPKGMTKGQIIINGHDAGRYFVNTPDGKSVPPQELYYLPEPWLDAEGENQLLLFDEHGHPPADIELHYNECGPYG